MAKSKQSSFGFNDRIQNFFTNPDKFFDEIKSESFLTSVKYFGLFLLLTILGNVFFGKPANVQYGFFILVLGVMLVILYVLLPFLLSLSLKFFNGKLQFVQVLKLFLYNMSYLLVISVVLRIILSSLLKLSSNIYLGYFVSLGQVFVVGIFLLAFFYYTIVGLQKFFGVSSLKSMWIVVCFLKTVFLLVLLGGFLFFKVVGLGSALL